jgi:hypothetical protein
MHTYDWRSVLRALSPDQKSEDIPFTEHEFIEKWAKKASEEFGEDTLAIEIGAYCGSSTTILAQFFKVITIDMWYPLEDYRDETIGDNFQNFMETYKKFNLKGRVIPVLGSTTYLQDLPIDMHTGFCFVDADHSYEGAMSDLVFCHECLVPNGYLVVHDYPRAGTVKKAVDEFMEKFNYKVLEVCGDGVVALGRSS